MQTKIMRVIIKRARLRRRTPSDSSTKEFSLPLSALNNIASKDTLNTSNKMQTTRHQDLNMLNSLGSCSGHLTLDIVVNPVDRVLDRGQNRCLQCGLLSLCQADLFDPAGGQGLLCLQLQIQRRVVVDQVALVRVGSECNGWSKNGLVKVHTRLDRCQWLQQCITVSWPRAVEHQQLLHRSIVMIFTFTRENVSVCMTYLHPEHNSLTRCPYP